MKIISIFAVVLYIFACSYSSVFAATPTPSFSPSGVSEEAPSALGDSLHGFFSGFDWIADGLIFNTPDVTRNTITLQDGTTLEGISNFKNIFYDIAIPVFAIIIAASALFHIGNDNKIQLVHFFKRLGLVAILFILSPYLLSYSIQFVNLLNEKIMQEQTLNLVTFLTEYVQNGDFNNLMKFSISPVLFFSPTTILQMLVVIISMGFLLIGFLYIVFQAVIRFFALVILTVLLPLAIPFALSEKTENITNNYFRTWFTFLIQQPAFVLGFALITTLFGNLLKSHSLSIGTLFMYAGSLVFLGGVNVFIARIFSNGWELLRTNAQSMLGSVAITGFGLKTIHEFKKGMLFGQTNSLRSQMGYDFGRKMGFLVAKKEQNEDTRTQEQEPIHYTRPNSYGYSKSVTKKYKTKKNKTSQKGKR